MAVQATLASVAFQNMQMKDSAGEPRRARTGCATIDEALRGGFDFGHISCLSGGNNGANNTISLHTIIEHLLSSVQAQVAVIDTTGSFEVVKLHHVLSTQAAQRPTRYQSAGGTLNPEGCLDRVKLMRVFDFVGLTEATSELKGALEKTVQFQAPPVSSNKSAVVADSEDEDEDILAIRSPAKETRRYEDANLLKSVSPLPWMLLIDNLSNVIQPIFKSNYIQGQALCTTFLRSLTHLTRDHNICTILVNNVIAPKIRTDKITNEDERPRREQPNDFGASSVFEQPSIFASTSIRPALGKTLTVWVDLHILLSVLPTKKRDAHIMYGSYPDHVQQRANVSHVAEVLADRWDGRVGRWGAFHVVEGSTLKGVS